MIIAGGTYGERCYYPRWDQIYGSGLRSAIALADVSPGTTLHTYVSGEWFDDVDATLSSLGLRGVLTRTSSPISFAYLHAFDRMEIPTIDHTEPLLEASGDTVLRFGMVEGDAKVSGSRVVFDPQSSAEPFQLNGSTAQSLVQVATQAELFELARAARRPEDLERMTWGERLREGVIALKELTPAIKMTLVKDGLGGLTLFTGDEPVTIPTYAAESYFRIGSGDVIAAAFAYAWGELHMAPAAAADYAARSAAYFVEGPRLPLPKPEMLQGRSNSTERTDKLRIVGIGDFELQDLLRSTEDWLERLGKPASYRSLDIDDPAPEDASDLLLVGTHSTRRQLEAIASAAVRPIVVFWPGVGIQHARELFPTAVIVNDYATALYHAMRSA